MPHDFAWENIAIAVILYIVFALWLGWQSGFLNWQPQPAKLVLRVMATSLIAPAILEEAVFRVLLLPDLTKFSSQLVTQSVLSLLLFVLYHPVNAATTFPRGKPAFFDPIFLCLAAALGAICTFSYWQTGSIWLSVAIHWLTVFLWLLCFGGWGKLTLDSNRNSASN